MRCSWSQSPQSLAELLSYILGNPDQRGRKAGARSRSTEVTKLDLEYRVAWVHRSHCSSSEEREEEKGSFQ